MSATSTILRIAAGLAAIQYLAHTVLFLRAKPTHGKEEIELVERMQSLRWNFRGSQRSYWDFYFGYGLLVILWGYIEIVLLWQLAGLAKTPSVSVAPFVATLLIANVGHGILALRYFFLLPALFDVLVVIALLVALVVK